MPLLNIHEFFCLCIFVERYAKHKSRIKSSANNVAAMIEKSVWIPFLGRLEAIIFESYKYPLYKKKKKKRERKRKREEKEKDKT